MDTVSLLTVLVLLLSVAVGFLLFVLFFEKKLKQDELEHVQKLSDNFQQLAESMPQIVWIMNEKGEGIYLNHHFRKYTGYELNEISWVELLHPDDLYRVTQVWGECLKSGNDYDIQYRLRSKNGEYRWFLVRAVAVRDDFKKITKWLGTATDIDDQKKATDSLKEALKKASDLKFALDQSSIVATTDARGVITFVNDKFCEISKFKREELIGNTHQLINSGYHPKEFFTELWQTISSGEIWRGEVKNKAKDGSYYWVYTVIVPFLNDKGLPYQYMAIRNDITQRKNSEVERAQLVVREQVALSSSRLKSEFLANMSHEIRTPINGIIGMTNLLSETELGDEQRKFVGSISSSSNILLTLINDILDLSKVESGKLELEELQFNLESLIEDVRLSFETTAKTKSLDFICKIEPSTQGDFFGDPSRIRQVLNNLLSNAFKFTDQGSVSLNIKTVGSRNKKCQIEFEVCDTGIGIPQEALPKLFQNFAQADASTSRKFGGTGLGLAISKKLAELMGGSITVASVEHKGSRFAFTVELLKTEKVAAVTPEEVKSELSKIERAARRILIVEDNPVNKEITLRMIIKAGFRADAVANGLEAIEAMQRIPYDLLLMDCQMPEMDGYEATKFLRKQKFDQPIIALTANAFKEDRERCLECGMSDYITKPIREASLIQTVDHWLNVGKNLDHQPYQSK